MFRFCIAMFVIFPLVVFGVTLKKENLVGKWIPSGEMPREEGVADYALSIK